MRWETIVGGGPVDSHATAVAAVPGGLLFRVTAEGGDSAGAPGVALCFVPCSVKRAATFLRAGRPRHSFDE